MKRKLSITLGFSILLVLTACGSDSKKESQVKKKDFILIYQHQDDCHIDDKKGLAKTLEIAYQFPKLINRNTFISFNKDNTQFCENYNRTFDDTTCAIFNIEDDTEKSCVIGFDFK